METACLQRQGKKPWKIREARGALHVGMSSPGDQKDRKLKGEKEERRGNTRNISPRLAFLLNTASDFFAHFWMSSQESS